MNRITITKILCTVVVIMLAAGVSWMYAADMPPASNKMKPDHAPTPFSAAEIRQGCPLNRKIVFQVETFGKPMFFQTMIFDVPTNEGTTVESFTKTADGKMVGKRQYLISKWTELQAHASFPAKDTVITNEKYTTPAGTFDCWLYTISTEATGKKGVKKLWFAKNLPGPPVGYEDSVDGQVTYKMVMLRTGK